MNESPTEVLAPTQQKPSDTPQQLSMSSDVLDTLMGRAKQFPRDIEVVLRKAQQELEVVPELAARSYYSIPYNQGKQNETLVEGPSIKAAMTLARGWGNCFNQGRVQDEDKNNVICQGIFIDLETGLLTLREIKMSKYYKPRGQQGVVPKNADMLYNSVQAGISKAVRNAILASLPDWLVYSYFKRAKEIVVNPPASIGKPVASLEDRILKAKQFICKTFNVKPQDMETYITDNADMIEDDSALLVHLQGLYNSIKDGNAKVSEVFGVAAAPAAVTMPQAQK